MLGCAVEEKSLEGKKEEAGDKTAWIRNLRIGSLLSQTVKIPHYSFHHWKTDAPVFIV